MQRKEKPKAPRGRPSAKIPRINATASQIAQAMFSAAKPINPSLRLRKKPVKGNK